MEQDYLDSEDTDGETGPPVPPPLDPDIYDMLLKSIDNNNSRPDIKPLDLIEHFI